MEKVSKEGAKVRLEKLRERARQRDASNEAFYNAVMSDLRQLRARRLEGLNSSGRLLRQ